MDIHKEFTNQIIFKRKAAVRDLITGERSLQLESLKPDSGKLIDELDRIFFTIDFLEKNGFIQCRRYHDRQPGTLFNGFSFDDQNVDAVSQVYAVTFLKSKLDGGAYGWNIEMNPGLLAFVKNGYKTDEQLKERNNLRLAVGVSILSSILTAVFTGWLTEAPLIKFIFN